MVPLLALGVLLALQPNAWAGDLDRARLGAAYLASQQLPDGSIPAFSPIGSTADAVLGFVAAGAGRQNMNLALVYLQSQVAEGNVNTLGLRAKVVLALVAGGRDPSHIGGHDLVNEIQSTLGQDGRYGDDPVLDDALAVLAVDAAVGHQPVEASNWLIEAQCPDGGWAFDEPYDPAIDDSHCHSGPNDFFDSDSNTTSYVVQALEATRLPAFEVSPFGFFKSVRDPVHGGWSYSLSFVLTDTNSTSLVIQAYVAGGMPVPAGGMSALRALQDQSCGAWSYTWEGSDPGPPDIGATIAAVPAVVRVALPVDPGPVSTRLPAIGACQ
jgi:hypothetical protein